MSLIVKKSVAEFREFTPQWISAVLDEISSAFTADKVIYYESEYRVDGVIRFNISIYPPERVKTSTPQEDGAE